MVMANNPANYFRNIRFIMPDFESNYLPSRLPRNFPILLATGRWRANHVQRMPCLANQLSRTALTVIFVL